MIKSKRFWAHNVQYFINYQLQSALCLCDKRHTASCLRGHILRNQPREDFQKKKQRKCKGFLDTTWRFSLLLNQGLATDMTSGCVFHASNLSLSAV